METITNLEDQLVQDMLGHTRQALITRLNQAVTELSRQQREPGEAERYQQLERQRQSCLAAIQIIEAIWQHHH